MFEGGGGTGFADDGDVDGEVGGGSAGRGRGMEVV